LRAAAGDATSMIMISRAESGGGPMHLDLDVGRRRVVVFGTVAGSRRVLRRCQAGGANVTAALDGPFPPAAEMPGELHSRPVPASDDQHTLLSLLAPAWLVVVVDPPASIRDRVRQLSEQLQILLVTEPAAADTGSVTLVGGGPGCTKLLTLAAIEALRDADVVFYDRLAPREELTRLAPGAELIDVGKSPYHHPISQNCIEHQLVERAKRGLAVVRLKGGDPFVLGRGGEELQACLRAEVPVRVVPGVSSAVAVPGAVGIPVTHRGVAHSYAVISGHVPPSSEELGALVALDGTIVILMGIGNLPQIAAGLICAGLDASTPAAVIERGFSDNERSAFASLAELPERVRRLDIRSPAVIVIGQVVRLALPGQEHSVLTGLGSLASTGWPIP
jgi:uroporphyrin-III C-methyltransferase